MKQGKISVFDLTYYIREFKKLNLTLMYLKMHYSDEANLNMLYLLDEDRNIQHKYDFITCAYDYKMQLNTLLNANFAKFLQKVREKYKNV